MNNELIAKASIKIEAPISKVWAALITPAMIKHYMCGTEVISNWKKGSSIVWKSEWKGKPYEDKGTILKIEPETQLKYTQFSLLNGFRDVPENYHTLTYKLSGDTDETYITLSQDNNAREKEMEFSQKRWSDMLVSLKNLIEK